MTALQNQNQVTIKDLQKSYNECVAEHQKLTKQLSQQTTIEPEVQKEYDGKSDLLLSLAKILIEIFSHASSKGKLTRSQLVNLLNECIDIRNSLAEEIEQSEMETEEETQKYEKHMTELTEKLNQLWKIVEKIPKDS